MQGKWERMKKTVDWRFKFLYVIGIISVVVGHTGEGVSLFYEWFTPYSFHLPLFMFASGYLYKENSIDNVSFYIKRKFINLIIPLYLWNIFYGGGAHSLEILDLQ